MSISTQSRSFWTVPTNVGRNLFNYFFSSAVQIDYWSCDMAEKWRFTACFAVIRGLMDEIRIEIRIFFEKQKYVHNFGHVPTFVDMCPQMWAYIFTIIFFSPVVQNSYQSCKMTRKWRCALSWLPLGGLMYKIRIFFQQKILPTFVGKVVHICGHVPTNVGITVFEIIFLPVVKIDHLGLNSIENVIFYRFIPIYGGLGRKTRASRWCEGSAHICGQTRLETQVSLYRSPDINSL